MFCQHKDSPSRHHKKRPVSDTMMGSLLVFAAGSVVDYVHDMERGPHLDRLTHKTAPAPRP
jgi:hypothetical protein